MFDFLCMFNLCESEDLPMYSVSITRLRLRSYLYLPLFMLHAMRSSRQAAAADGILGFETRNEAGRVFWTKTIWSEETNMKRFRGSGAHQLAMRLLSSICDEAAYTRWTQDSPELPTWEEAHSRMLREGHLSKVKHPSLLHAAGQTAPPLPGPGAA
jgi:hypothetical protein